MAHYLIVAWDGTDPQARERRLSVRQAHLANIEPLTETGQMVIGGALLDRAGEMIGSACVVDFATEDDLDRWLTADPYVTGRVWQKIEVHPLRIAVQAKPKTGAPAG